MREILLKALQAHYEGVIAIAQANVEVYLQNPVGVGEHSDIIETADKEITKLAEAHDSLEMLETYFITKTPRI